MAASSALALSYARGLALPDLEQEPNNSNQRQEKPKKVESDSDPVRHVVPVEVLKDDSESDVVELRP